MSERIHQLPNLVQTLGLEAKAQGLGLLFTWSLVEPFQNWISNAYLLYYLKAFSG